MKEVKKKSFIARAFKAAKNRALRWLKYNDLHYFLNKERVLTKNFLKQFPNLTDTHFALGNYFLDGKYNLNKESIIYSFGILDEISFDKAVVNQIGANVFMYDPTPLSIEFMSKQKDDRFKFSPFGVWTENTTLLFSFPEFSSSASVVSGEENKNDKSFEAPCKDLKTIMSENRHNHIDVLKMDIEGAALSICEYMIDKKIYPGQIVVEFERPRDDWDGNIQFFDRVNKLCDTYKSLGYEIYQLPRKRYKYFAVELILEKIKK